MQHATAPQMDSGTILGTDASVNLQTAGLVTLVVLLMVTLTGTETDVPASLRTAGQEKLVVHPRATTIGRPTDANVTLTTSGMERNACQEPYMGLDLSPEVHKNPKKKLNHMRIFPYLNISGWD
jgi:hypothetical protein